ncbi:glycosyltransferase [Luteolibacter sp. AS25]|uniref:glycosyltransferase n=1 Tax=Luteolibacter sp. AS25 TaxID=3135776 RepID=UPI00398AF2E7
MSDIFLRVAFAIYVIASAGLLFYGLNAYVLIFLFGKRAKATQGRQLKIEAEWNKNHPSGKTDDLPKITTQIPLYNEFNVAERCIRAVAAFDYPADLHQIQILDDSNDETCELVDRVAAELREKGIWIDVFRREIRHGYKAGALSDAMPEAHGEFIAIFDSDFVPEPDFLRRLLPHFIDEETGLVQARWGHLNTKESLLTRAQSVGIDGHFAIEQTARSANHLFLNFNGTAGIWRRKAMEDAGGWAADTLTEDLDLSYRAQLKGWHMEYVPHVMVPAELPETYSAFKSQQFRWAKGSIQTAIKLLPTVFRSEERPFAKFQSIFHLCHYFAHPLMFTVAMLALPALKFLSKDVQTSWLILIAGPLLAATIGPSILYVISQHYLYPDSWKKRILLLPALVLVGFGICISNTRAVLEAILGIKSGFVRTPKRGSKVTKSYNPVASVIPILEIAAALYCILSVYIYYRHGSYGIIPFLTLYIGGFGLVGISSLREQIHAGGKS